MRLERMAEVRRRAGLNQRAVGERIGRDQSYVSKIERGMSVPNESAEDIARALSCDVSDLVQPQEPTLTFKLSELSPEVLALLKK